MFEHLSAAVKRHKVKVVCAVFLTTMMVIIATKGDRITAVFGSVTATLGAFGLSNWSVVIGIFCTVTTSVATVVTNLVYRKKLLALQEKHLKEKANETY
ncbi:hypothetical protein C9980_25220 [Vibrio mediterranei]|uniref:Holin n=2 Tax=Vibrio TaxID=662 RepID=A0AAN1FLK8_9VIBR|nr:HP1 family phage holin [Vibrio mediterranei]ASI92482.1 hypothetical protein BSZ05_22040 [Vibrio mediterranei]PTC02002.1 hypothetical protein C9980_25220 [Vibrio mediterranei]